MTKEDNKKFSNKKESSGNQLPKIVIFISGTGTNMQEVIDGVESGMIKAEIVGVISNKYETKGIQRAKKSGLKIIVISSRGKLNSSSRPAYEEELSKATLELNPKLIVLAGWMLVLGDEFLKKMEEQNIVVINLHPALLTQEDEEEIMTSHGNIPVIRGVGAIKKAYDDNLPVSGVTIHKVVPGNNVDVGPIILQEEVKRMKSDTFEEWELRMHEVEHKILPLAVVKILKDLEK